MTTATVLYHQEPDGWWAESPDFPSFFAAGDSYEETKKHVRVALHELSGEPHLGLRHLMWTQPAKSVEAPSMQRKESQTGMGQSGGTFVLAA